MKSMLFVLLLAALPAQATMYVSDLDDTIKITNSGELDDAVWNGVFSHKVFAGMPAFLRAGAAGSDSLHVVTGSSSLVRGKVRDLMRRHGIPADSLTLRSNMLEPLFAYKTRVIGALLERHPGETVVFLGDDVGKDPEVYRAMAERFPGRVAAIYIRPVKHRALLSGQVPYVTAFDLAAGEFLAGRFPADQLPTVAGDVEKSPVSLLLPGFTWCPEKLEGTGLPTAGFPSSEARRVQERVERVCGARRSGN